MHSRTVDVYFFWGTSLRENGELRGRLEEVRGAGDLMRAQLEAKDSQIRASDSNLRAAPTLATRTAA